MLSSPAMLPCHAMMLMIMIPVPRLPGRSPPAEAAMVPNKVMSNLMLLLYKVLCDQWSVQNFIK